MPLREKCELRRFCLVIAPDEASTHGGAWLNVRKTDEGQMVTLQREKGGLLAHYYLFFLITRLSSSTHLSELFAISQDIMIITLVHSRPQQSCDHDSHASYISGPPSNSNRSSPGVRIGIYPPLSLCIGCPSLPPNESSSEKNRRSQNATG